MAILIMVDGEPAAFDFMVDVVPGLIGLARLYRSVEVEETEGTLRNKRDCHARLDSYIYHHEDEWYKMARPQRNIRPPFRAGSESKGTRDSVVDG